MHAVNEDELVHGPAYWLNRVFLHIAFGMQERDMRVEILLCEVATALPRDRDTGVLILPSICGRA